MHRPMHVAVHYYKPHLEEHKEMVQSCEINNKAMELNLNSIAKISSICCENLHGDRLKHTTPPFLFVAGPHVATINTTEKTPFIRQGF
jgi:hypothetical protein